MIDIALLGTGGMMPLPRRWLSSLLVRVGGDVILFDCGEGTQIAWRATRARLASSAGATSSGARSAPSSSVVSRARELVEFARLQGYRVDELVDIIESVR